MGTDIQYRELAQDHRSDRTSDPGYVLAMNSKLNTISDQRQSQCYQFQSLRPIRAVNISFASQSGSLTCSMVSGEAKDGMGVTQRPRRDNAYLPYKLRSQHSPSNKQLIKS